MLKRGNNPIKRTGIKKTVAGLGTKRRCVLKAKPKTPEQIEADREQYEADWEFYRHIWSIKPHICQVCGTPLYGDLLSIYIEHLLEKSTYPELRYEERNAVIVCGNCHSRKTDGNPAPAHIELIEKAKKQLLKNE